MQKSLSLERREESDSPSRCYANLALRWMNWVAMILWALLGWRQIWVIFPLRAVRWAGCLVRLSGPWDQMTDWRRPWRGPSECFMSLSHDMCSDSVVVLPFVTSAHQSHLFRVFIMRCHAVLLSSLLAFPASLEWLATTCSTLMHP